MDRLSVDEAERQWRIHGNEVLDADEEFQAAVRVAGLLAFMMGFYLWRFRFFWAICIYVVLLSICALAGRTISVHAVRNDHLGELVKAAHDKYIEQLTGKSKTVDS